MPVSPFRHLTAGPAYPVGRHRGDGRPDSPLTPETNPPRNGSPPRSSRGALPATALVLLMALGGSALGFRPTAAMAAEPAGRGWRSGVQAEAVDVTERPLTLLVMGVDARPGEPIDRGVRPDALGVLRLDPATGTCRLLAVPRDTRAELPGYGPSKVNHALVVGGVPYQRQVVEGLLGVEIDRFLLVDFGAVEAVVETVGGLTLDVPEAFAVGDGRSFAAGEQTLDGPAVLAYARYRGGPDGDLGRIERQQQVLRALLAEAPDLQLGPIVGRLLPALEGHVRTDLAPAEIVGLARRFRPSCTAETLWTATLAGTTATFDDPVARQPLSYLVVDAAEIARQRALLLDAEGRPG